MAAGVLAMVLGLAAAPRLFRLSFPGLSSDEAFSWRLTQYGWSEVVSRAAADFHPPLYFLLLKAWLTLWGTSVLSLRSLSVVLGLIAVAMAYAVCRAFYEKDGAQGDASGPGRGLLAALLVACHSEQVMASRNARMYSLGVVFAALTAYCLLRAMGSRGRRAALWWSAHGAATALSFYIHYYAYLTTLAQVLFVFWEGIGRWRKTSRREAWSRVRGLFLAGGVALVFYGPWVPVLLSQTREIRGRFLIAPLSPATVGKAFSSWVTGLPAGTEGVHTVAWLLMAGVVWAIWRSHRPMGFFLIQAGVPWIVSVGVSVLSARPIFLPRYLVFSQFFFLAMCGAALESLGRLRDRIAGSALLGGTLFAGLVLAIANTPSRPSATEQAVTFLSRHEETGDLLLTESARALNRFRFFATRDRLSLDSRYLMSPSQSEYERLSHVASLDKLDVLWDNELDNVATRRLWMMDPRDDTSPEGWRLVFSRTFEGGDGSRLTLLRYGRKKERQ